MELITEERIKQEGVFFIGSWEALLIFVIKRGKFKGFGDGIEGSKIDIWKFFYQLLSVDFIEFVGHVEMVVFVDGIFMGFLLWNWLVTVAKV